MKIGERFGEHDELFEDINGGNARLVYISDRNPDRLAEKYNKIKAGKQIVTGYFDGKLHWMLCFVEGKIKLTRSK